MRIPLIVAAMALASTSAVWTQDLPDADATAAIGTAAPEGSLLGAALPHSSAAVWPDGTAELPVGTRVRVTATGERLKGVILAADPEALTLVVEGRHAPIRLARNSIRSIEVGARRSARAGAARGAGRGFLLGGGAGAVIGTGLLIGDRSGRTRDAALAPLVFGAWSALAGGVIGALNPGEGWRPLSTERVGIGLTTRDGRGGGVTLSVSF